MKFMQRIASSGPFRFLSVAFALYMAILNFGLHREPRVPLYDHGIMACLDMLASLICISTYRRAPTVDRFGTVRLWTMLFCFSGCREIWLLIQTWFK